MQGLDIVLLRMHGNDGIINILCLRLWTLKCHVRYSRAYHCLEVSYELRNPHTRRTYGNNSSVYKDGNLPYGFHTSIKVRARNIAYHFYTKYYIARNNYSGGCGKSCNFNMRSYYIVNSVGTQLKKYVQALNYVHKILFRSPFCAYVSHINQSRISLVRNNICRHSTVGQTDGSSSGR